MRPGSPAKGVVPGICCWRCAPGLSRGCRVVRSFVARAQNTANHARSAYVYDREGM